MSIVNKKAQIWSFDLVVALLILVLGIILIYFYAVNYKSSSFDDIGELYYDADVATGILLGEGHYSILSDGKVNQTKLDEFSSLSDSEIKARYGVINYFYFSLPNMTISGVPTDSIGILNTSVVDNQILVSRIVIYNNKPVKMEVIAWR